MASSKRRDASSMESWFVPLGRALGARSAVYGPPTPWTQRSGKSSSRVSARGGPTMEPYNFVPELAPQLWFWEGGRAVRTMFPASVEPRAKMRMELGQSAASPSSRSLRLMPPSWRASSCALEGAGSPRGTAETRAAVAERRAMTCMAEVFGSGGRRG